jgi:L-ascorbate metabolism protein UlaG (beta-lactamase superfamily)
MKELKGIDLMLVPSGGTYTMDNPEAAEATIALNPKKAVPMHIWDTNPAEFKKMVEEGCDTKVILMKPGETLTL